MADEPQVAAWFLDEPIADDDPLAAVKWRAQDLDGAGEVLEETARTGTVAARAEEIDDKTRCIGENSGEEWFEAEGLDAMHAAGVSWADLDSASYIALTLAEAERYGGLAEDLAMLAGALAH